MAINYIRCNKCNFQFSDQAKKCPKCATPLSKSLDDSKEKEKDKK